MAATTTVPVDRRLTTISPEMLEAARAPNGGASSKKEKSGKKKPIKPIIGVVVLLLVAFMMKGKFIKPHYGPDSPPPNGQIVELQNEAGSATITTNLSDGHLAQLGISLQLTAAASTKQVAKLEDELMGSTIAALGEEDYGELLDPTGRAALATELLHTYQKELGKSEGGQQVSAVYFTSFVLQ